MFLTPLKSAFFSLSIPIFVHEVPRSGVLFRFVYENSYKLYKATARDEFFPDRFV